MLIRSRIRANNPVDGNVILLRRILVASDASRHFVFKRQFGRFRKKQTFVGDRDHR
jgi:hypothetical protein